jgi:hypothetical protein
VTTGHFLIAAEAMRRTCSCARGIHLVTSVATGFPTASDQSSVVQRRWGETPSSPVRIEVHRIHMQDSRRNIRCSCVRKNNAAGKVHAASSPALRAPSPPFQMEERDKGEEVNPLTGKLTAPKRSSALQSSLWTHSFHGLDTGRKLRRFHNVCVRSRPTPFLTTFNKRATPGSAVEIHGRGGS